MTIGENLDKKLIFLNLKASDNREVLQIMGEAMVREGYVHDDFPYAVWEREKDYPTGLDVNGIGVAIPHTEAHHAKKEGIALAILSEPVEFDAMGEEDCRIPVKIIIMFTVAGKEKHLDRLIQIIKLIQEDGLLSGLIAAKNTEQVIETIRNKEQNTL